MKPLPLGWSLVALTIFTITFWCATFIYVYAAVPETYTNDNFFTSEHDTPQSFSRDSEGNFFGVTKSGKRFEQRIIDNPLEIRLQKFMIDQAFFYVSDRGIIDAPTDLMALSIYLMRTS